MMGWCKHSKGVLSLLRSTCKQGKSPRDPHPNPLPEGRAKTPSADTVAEEGKEGPQLESFGLALFRMQIPATVEHSGLTPAVFAPLCRFDLVHLQALWIEHDTVVCHSTRG